jgi:hypothetical protein
MRYTLSIFALLFLILFALNNAFAFRCSTRLIHVGDSQFDIHLRCGNPTSKNIVKTNGFIIEKWYYNCGPYRFTHILTFIDGTLKTIDKGDYGNNTDRKDCQ